MVALALMVSCMPSAYTISASEAFGDGTEDIFTDGEITSEPAAEESTPDVSSADQEETEQAQQSTLTYENDSVKVTAEALEDGALPQNTALKADGVNENSSVSYDTVSQKLSAAATDKGSSLRGFFAYDVYFADGDGNRVEPNGRVRVTFEYKTPAAPELTDAASTSVTVEKLHYNSSTGDTDVNTLQANEDLKVLNVNEGKQIQTLQVETGNAAVFAVMWDSPETADVEAEAVSGNEDEVPIASEELTDGMDISDEPEQDAAETPAAENPEVTPDAEPSEEPAVEPTEAPAENPDAEPTEAPAEDPDVVEEPAEDIESPDEVPAADENGETSLIEVLGDDTNLRVSPSIEAEVLATVNAGTQLTLLDTVTAEDGATWYKVSWEGTEAYIRSDMAQVVDSSDEAEEVEDVLESEEVSYSQTIGDVVVTATAAKDVLPDDAQFVVTPIKSEDAQYEDIAARLEEKAENEEYSIAGFLAYDIYFLNSAGEKINPEDGKVKISMEYKNAAAPEEVKESDAVQMEAEEDETSQENTEAKELSVSVMHFVEENGEVTSVVDMTKENSATVETNEAGEVQKAEFETESFSTFTITWTQKQQNLSGEVRVNVKCVDENGKDITATGVSSIKATKGTAIRLADYEPYISGYGFVKAQIGGATYDNSNSNELKLIKVDQDSNNNWAYSYSNDTDSNTKSWSIYTTGVPTIYLVYSVTKLSIQDDLMNSGNLIPVLTDELKNEIERAENENVDVSYIWYKSINNGDFEAVDKIKVSGDNYNISTNEDNIDCLNVALDGGALSEDKSSVRYKVALKIGEQKFFSGEYNVRYYEELHNGGFETPSVTADHPGATNWQYSNENYKAQGGVWQTTGTNDKGSSPWCDTDGADIEIIRADGTLSGDGGRGYAWHGDKRDAEGKANGQFAELNCETAGALYQDVITYEGETLNFWLSHRARGRNSNTTEYDTMYVVMMPTSIAKTMEESNGQNSQQQLLNLVGKYYDISSEINASTNPTSESATVVYNGNTNDKNNGVLITKVVSDDTDWHNVQVSDTYIAKSAMTRFFFISGKTAAPANGSGYTEGNFLDRVGFSQNLPPANSGTFTLKVEKRFDGLESTDIENLKDKMTFTIKAYNNDQEKTPATTAPLNGTHFTLREMGDATSDGSYVKILTGELPKDDVNNKYIYEVEETNSQVSGKILTTTQTVVGGKVQSDRKSTLLGEKDSATFTVTNTYTPITLSSIMDSSKTAKVKNWDDRTYDITINASSKNTVQSTETGKTVADIMLFLDVSTSMGYDISDEYEYIYVGKNTPVQRKNLNTNETYYIKVDNSYKQMRYSRKKWKVYDDSWHGADASNEEYSNCEIYEYRKRNRLDALKAAVNQFIESTAEKSEESNIGITAFNDTVVSTVGLGNVKVQKDTLEAAVNKLTYSGGTSPAKGLEEAKELLDARATTETENPRPKYVILFTDGDPTGSYGRDWKTYEQTAAETQARELKTGYRGNDEKPTKKPYTVFTVGFSLTNRAKTFLAGGTYDNEEYPGIATTGCAKEASNAADLSQIFQDINSTITNNTDIAGATITDIIDQRFEIMVSDKVITDEVLTDGKYTLSDGGVITKRDDGTYQVEWKNQTIPNPNNTEHNQKSWTKTITVKAKDDFIGGNNILTNVGAGSKITVGALEKKLDQPKVNVKENLQIQDKTVTIYKGDTLPAINDIQNAILKISETSYLNGTISADDVKEYLSLQWYKLDEKGNRVKVDKSEIPEKPEKPEADTEYYLEVTYTPNQESTDASKLNTTTSDGVQHYVEGKTLRGTYKINVKKGQIQITKNVTETTTEKDRTFKFDVKDEKNNSIPEVTVTVKKGESRGTVTIDNLSRGTYTVTEKQENQNYEIKEFGVSTETDCQNSSSLDEKSITFTLGTDTDQKDVITDAYEYTSGGVNGAAFYTNEIVTELDLKKTNKDGTKDLPNAKFQLEKWEEPKEGTEGGWKSVSEDYNDITVNNGEESKELTNLHAGRYKLTEIEAPNGYCMLGASIYFKIESGVVTLTDKDGNDTDTPIMWTLAKDNKGGQVLTIKNTEIYSLPSSGGPGTYGFTISGVAILATALLLFINNKRREEEAKRS